MTYIHLFKMIVAHMNEKEKRKNEKLLTASDENPRPMGHILYGIRITRRITMKESDVQKEVRVWQRVRQENQNTSPLGENLQGLIMEQTLLAAAYLQLSHRTGGLEATTLMRLARQSRAQAACLRGVWALLAANGSAPKLRSFAKLRILI